MHRAPRKKRRWPKIFGFTLLGVVILGILAVVFSVQLNNGLRSATGKDTPVDTAVKSQLVKGIEAKKTGDASHDALIDKAAETIQQTPMKTITEAAGNQQKAAELVSQTTGVPEASAQVVTQAIFNDSKFDGVRKAMANGDWVQVYQQGKTLSSDPDIQALTRLVQ